MCGRLGEGLGGALKLAESKLITSEKCELRADDYFSVLAKKSCLGHLLSPFARSSSILTAGLI